MRGGVALALWSVAVGAAGCSNSLDSLYGEPADPPGEASGAGDREPPPALPLRLNDEQAPVCEECAATKCTTERENCLMDDACTALLGCKGNCSDPACISGCEADYGYSPWYDDYLLCVFSEECQTPCPPGDNWECVGEYSWPEQPNSRFAVDFHFTQNTAGASMAYGSARVPFALAGAEVRSCGELDCDPPFDVGRVEADGHVSLKVAVPLAASPRDWRGHLEIVDREVQMAGVRTRLYRVPVSEPRTVRAFFFDGLSDPTPRESSPTPRLTVLLRDCLGFRVADNAAVPIELSDSEGGAPLEPATQNTDGRGSATWFEPVDAVVDIRALHPQRGLLSKRTVRVLPGWTNWVVLWPCALNDCND